MAILNVTQQYELWHIDFFFASALQNGWARSRKLAIQSPVRVLWAATGRRHGDGAAGRIKQAQYMLREPVRVMRHDRVGGVMVSAQDYQAMRAFYADRLRQTMDKTAEQAARAGLNDASALAHWVEVPPAIAAQDFCRDADDDKFIHAALAAKAPWLVTGDQDLLDLPPLPHLRILSPADATQNPEFCG